MNLLSIVMLIFACACSHHIQASGTHSELAKQEHQKKYRYLKLFNKGKHFLKAAEIINACPDVDKVSQQKMIAFLLNETDDIFSSSDEDSSNDEYSDGECSDDACTPQQAVSKAKKTGLLVRQIKKQHSEHGILFLSQNRGIRSEANKDLLEEFEDKENASSQLQSNNSKQTENKGNNAKSDGNL